MIKAKQIEKQLAGYVYFEQTGATGTSSVVTTALTTALETAGDNGRAVPFRVASSTDTGVIATGNNIVGVYNEDGDRISNDEGLEVYGRVTQASGVYTVSYFISDEGVETAYNIGAAQTLRLSVPYKFSFHDLPADAIVGTETRFVQNDPSNGSPQFQENLTVTGANTLSQVTRVVNTNRPVSLVVNSLAHPRETGVFTVAGKVITWVPAVAGYDLDTDDKVTIVYYV